MPDDDVKPPHPPAPPFPRMATYEGLPPPTLSREDPSENAHDLRHSIKGRLNLFRLLSATLRREGAHMTAGDRDALLDMLDRTIEDCRRDVDLVRHLPPQPPPTPKEAS